MAFRTNKMPVLQNKSASGAIASFDTILTKPLEECTSLITGYQEGNGDPYPAGGSAQKWDEEYLDGYYDRNNQGVFVSNSTFFCSKDFIAVLPNEQLFWYAESPQQGRMLFYDANGNYISATESNSPNTVITVPNNAYKMHFYIYKYGGTTMFNVSINNPSTDTSYHPYSNIRPLHAFSSGSLTARGKNIVPINARSQTASGTTITVDANGIATVSGTGTASHFFEYYRGYSFPKGTFRFTAWVNGEEYTQSNIPTAPYRFYLNFVFEDDSQRQINSSNSFELSQNIKSWILYIQTRNGYVFNDEVKIQIEVGTFSSSWEKFNSNTYTFTFGQDIYSGYIDWKRGVVVGEKVILKDYTDLYFYTSQTYPTTRSYRVVTPKERAVDTFCLSNKFKRAVLGANTPYCMEVAATATEWVRKSIFFELPDDYDTVEKAKQYLIDNDVQFAYSLFTPIEIPLTPQIINTLRGQTNNIFCDTGDTSVVFKDLDIAKRGSFREVFKIPS